MLDAFANLNTERNNLKIRIEDFELILFSKLIIEAPSTVALIVGPSRQEHQLDSSNVNVLHFSDHCGFYL